MVVSFSFPNPFSKQSTGFDGSECTAHNPPSSLILIVEDDPFVAQVMRGIFTSRGINSILATNGSDAISLFDQYKDVVSCVVIDFDIPGVHSSRVVSHIREISEQTRIVLSSGHCADRVEQSFPMSSVDWFICKPFNAEALVSCLELAKN